MFIVEDVVVGCCADDDDDDANEIDDDAAAVLDVAAAVPSLLLPLPFDEDVTFKFVKLLCNFGGNAGFIKSLLIFK